MLYPKFPTYFVMVLFFICRNWDMILCLYEILMNNNLEDIIVGSDSSSSSSSGQDSRPTPDPEGGGGGNGSNTKILASSQQSEKIQDKPSSSNVSDETQDKDISSNISDTELKSLWEYNVSKFDRINKQLTSDRTFLKGDIKRLERLSLEIQRENLIPEIAKTFKDDNEQYVKKYDKVIKEYSSAKYRSCIESELLSVQQKNEATIERTTNVIKDVDIVRDCEFLLDDQKSRYQDIRSRALGLVNSIRVREKELVKTHDLLSIAREEITDRDLIGKNFNGFWWNARKKDK